MYRTLTRSIVLLAILMVIVQACSMPGTPTPEPTPGLTAIWYVTKLGNDSFDCRSPLTACLTINAAVSKAHDGAEIFIGPGTYEEHYPGSDIGVFIQDKNLVLHGSGTSGATATIISGTHAFAALAVNGTAIVTIDHVVLANSPNGFGLYLTPENPNVTLLDSVIQNNTLYGINILRHGSLTLDNVIITGNGRGNR